MMYVCHCRIILQGLQHCIISFGEQITSFNLFTGEEEFVHVFGDVLLRKAAEYVIPSTATEYASHFAQFVAQLWLYLAQWEHR